MLGKVTRMSRIKQLLQLYRQGMSNRGIGRTLGMDKETVNGFVRKLQANGFDIDELLSLEDPVLESRFMAGSAAYTDSRFEALKTQILNILPLLGQKDKRQKSLSLQDDNKKKVRSRV